VVRQREEIQNQTAKFLAVKLKATEREMMIHDTYNVKGNVRSRICDSQALATVGRERIHFYAHAELGHQKVDHINHYEQANRKSNHRGRQNDNIAL
jgi:hypothetical protein